MLLLIGWLCATLALLSCSRALASALRLPHPTVQLALGMLAGALVTTLGIDSGLRWHHFHDLVINLLLPILVFSAATRLEWQRIKGELGAILVLALVAIVITAGLVAFAVHSGIDHAGFPVAAALLTGVLLAATDPAAVTSQAQDSRASDILEARASSTMAPRWRCSASRSRWPSPAAQQRPARPTRKHCSPACWRCSPWNSSAAPLPGR